MLAAQYMGEQVLGRDADRGGPFACPECKSEVFLKKGQKITAHFAHKPNAACDYLSGETEEHRAAKLAIRDALANAADVERLGVEVRCGRGTADVFAVIRGDPVAIEVQLSHISVAHLRSRSEWYKDAGVAVLWVLLKAPDDIQSHLTSAAERWLHGQYGGCCYYWKHGDAVMPVHFAPHQLIGKGSAPRILRELLSSLDDVASAGPVVSIASGFAKDEFKECA